MYARHDLRRMRQDPNAMTLGGVLLCLGLEGIDSRPGRGAHRAEADPMEDTGVIYMGAQPMMTAILAPVRA